MIHNRGWDNLPEFSKTLYKATYFLPNETYDGWLDRIFTAYGNDTEHTNRMKKYAHNYWFHPSTPISSNGGTKRGLPISCMVQSISDNRESIINSWKESAWIGSEGTGIGKYWGNVRELGASIKGRGESSGIIPFMGVDEALSKAISQGGLRRLSIADYLPVWHPEIMEFLEIRSPLGDQGRRAPELHHGVVIDDKFMEAVIHNTTYELISPSTKKVVDTINAREAWNKLLDIRTTLKGEAYLLFIDTVNKNRPPEYITEDMIIETSQLCCEIALYTADNYTAICCLASVNAEYFDEWEQDKQFLPDCSDFLDNVIEDFIIKTKDKPGFENSRRSAINERAQALGVMGFHSMLQKKMIPWESPMAKGLNIKLFKHMRESLDAYQASLPLSVRCPLSKKAGTNRRNITTMAVAPTMSISSLCNVTSSGIEPWVTNAFTKKVKQGSFSITNKYLHNVMVEFICSNPISTPLLDWVDEQWNSIKKHEGSIQHLEWMDQNTKDVFKTAFEIDQRWVIDFAGDRQPFIDQSQSVNIFVSGGSKTQYISDLHVLAWVRGLKGLYYLRSSAINRASTSTNERKIIHQQEVDLMSDTCPSCG